MTASPSGLPAAPPGSGLRRRPMQARSRMRVTQMLDACDTLVAEVGYDALTTTAVAEAAGVSIGSLYQFFPDKRALVRALSLRYLDAFSRQVEDLFAQAHFDNWVDAVDSVVDLYVELHRSSPGFRAVHFGDVVDERLLAGGLEADEGPVDNNAVVAGRLDQLRQAYFPDDPSDESTSLTMAVALEAADAVLKLAFRRDPMGDDAVISLAKHVVRSALTAPTAQPTEDR